MEPRWETLKPVRWRSASGTRPLCAGSGLARVPGGFWAIADDLHHLIRIPDGKGVGRGYRLFPGEPPAGAAARKRVKKDLEALIDLGRGRLVAFPSGSKDRRARGCVIRLDKRGRFVSAREVDFRPLIDLLDAAIPGLNIEGGYVSRKRLVLLQRGNGRAGFNGVVKLRLKAFQKGLGGRWRAAALRIRVRKVPLGSWGRIGLAFTDGFFHEGVGYFSAAAEGGKDSYLDGKIAGSVIGALPKGGKPVILARLKGEKIEGLALKSAKDDLLEVCAVTDADDPRRASRLLRTWIRKLNPALLVALVLSGFAVGAAAQLPEVSIPESFYACRKDSDCAPAGDACRSCGKPIIINKKYLKKFDELDQKLRHEKGFIRACEACGAGHLKLKCVKRKCLQAPRPARISP